MEVPKLFVCRSNPNGNDILKNLSTNSYINNVFSQPLSEEEEAKYWLCLRQEMKRLEYIN